MVLIVQANRQSGRQGRRATCFGRCVSQPPRPPKEDPTCYAVYAIILYKCTQFFAYQKTRCERRPAPVRCLPVYTFVVLFASNAKKTGLLPHSSCIEWPWKTLIDTRFDLPSPDLATCLHLAHAAFDARAFPSGPKPYRFFRPRRRLECNTSTLYLWKTPATLARTMPLLYTTMQCTHP